jgi:bifunctional DNase/RNase
MMSTPRRAVPGGTMEIEMTIKGLMIDPITNMPIIILRDGDGQRMLPIWVGVFEANAIALQLESVQTPRPMTHDLMKNLLEEMGAHIERVVVCDLRENTFYATIHLRTEKRTIAIDARPSDAIALALRTQSPILVEETVIEGARSAENSKESGDVGRLRKWLEGLTEDELGKYKM